MAYLRNPRVSVYSELVEVPLGFVLPIVIVSTGGLACDEAGYCLDRGEATRIKNSGPGDASRPDHG
jgi:hypothetical protein